MEVTIVEQNPTGRGKNLYRGVIDTQSVVMAQGGQGSRFDLVLLTLSTGDKILVQGNASDWLEDVPGLYYVDIDGCITLDGCGQEIYFHSEESAQAHIDRWLGNFNAVVCDVPDAARRWMLAGIRVR